LRCDSTTRSMYSRACRSASGVFATPTVYVSGGRLHDVSADSHTELLSIPITDLTGHGFLSLEFMAGLITGEGCFSLAVRKKREDSLQILPIFQLFMNDRVTVKALAASLAWHGLPVNEAVHKKRGIGVWSRGCTRVKTYTETFAPLLTGQKRQAALVVDEFIASRRRHRASNARYTDDEIHLVERIRAINGNRRGFKNPLTYSRIDPRTRRRAMTEGESSGQLWPETVDQ